MTDITFNRRHALQGLLAISAAGALAACGRRDTLVDDARTLGDTEFATIKGFFSNEEMALLTALSDTIIPATDTPGAVAAGVPATLQGLATDWADGKYRAYWRGGLRDLNKVLPEFQTLDAVKREEVLGAYDAAVFSGKTKDQFYRDIKSTIARAYYMSEPGASLELAYEAVPGEFKGCVPLADYPKAWAT